MDLYVNWIFKFNFSFTEIAKTPSNNYWNEILRWYIFSFLRGPGIPAFLCTKNDVYTTVISGPAYSEKGGHLYKTVKAFNTKILKCFLCNKGPKYKKLRKRRY